MGVSVDYAISFSCSASFNELYCRGEIYGMKLIFIANLGIYLHLTGISASTPLGSCY